MNRELVISYLNLRKLIGFLGITLPFICLFGGMTIGGLFFEQSISFYYYTHMRDVLVGVLIGVGFFLISYKGYDKKDDFITTLAGILGMLIAVFPMTNPADPTALIGIFKLPSTTSMIFHSISAVCYFILLAYMSYFQFTQGYSETPSKKTRNHIYRTCGWVMFGGIFVVAFDMLFHVFKFNSFIWLMETIMLVAFGISWLVKGETIFKDSE